MTKTWPVARPSKILDDGALDEWARKHYPDAVDEWELGGASEWLDLWEWLERERGDVLNEFTVAWRRKTQGAA